MSTEPGQLQVYRDQVKPFGFMFSLFSGQLKLSRTARPVALFDGDLNGALATAFDRDTGKAVAADELDSYEAKLVRYHLQPESKFLNGDFVDEGTTGRRHIRVTSIELIGKEANRWEEQEHLGLLVDAEVSYGSPCRSRAALLLRIGELKPDFSDRELAFRLGWSRSRLAKLAAGKPIALSSQAAERAMRELVQLHEEARDTRQQVDKVQANIRRLIAQNGLLNVAAELQAEPSNLLKIARGRRRPTQALLRRMSADGHAN